MIDVYGIVQGPHTPPDVEEGIFVMIVVAVHDGEMHYDFELYSSDFNWLYDIQKHCMSNLLPYKINDKEEENSE